MSFRHRQERKLYNSIVQSECVVPVRSVTKKPSHVYFRFILTNDQHGNAKQHMGFDLTHILLPKT